MKERNFYKKSSSIKDFKNLTSEEKILFISSGYSVTDKLPREDAFTELKQKIKAGKKSGSANLTRRNHYIYWGIAATLFLLIGLSVFFRQKDIVSVLAHKGAHTEYLLPDNSLVFLNADSKISYSRSDFTDKRYLQLKGEAYFITKNGTNFVVSTRFGEIKTLGTTFNVNSRDNYFKVSCLTGKILVLSSSDSLIITERESVLLTGNKLTKKTEKNIEKTITWRLGEFHFDDRPLKSVFNEIERQFNVSVEARGIGNRFYTGSFYNKDLKEALDIICIPMGLKFEIRNNKKIIISDPPE
jgi:ferric-dicitrate binding protein FerR (iron transport regulator)